MSSVAGTPSSPRRIDPDGIVRLYFPGALLGPRKPHKEVVEAFTAARGDNLRLVFKAQLERRMNYLTKAAEADPMVCKNEPAPNSRLPKRICATKSEWERRRQEAKDNLDRAQTRRQFRSGTYLSEEGALLLAYNPRERRSTVVVETAS